MPGKDMIRQGERIYLRRMRDDDVGEHYLRWMNDPRVNRFLESRRVEQTPQTLAAFVRTMSESPVDDFLAIVLNDGDRHIGNLRIGDMDPHGVAHLGIVIGEKDCWGRGLAGEAIRLATSHAFENLGLRKLFAGFYAANAASERAFEKAGWKRDAVLSLHFVLDGVPMDKILMATFNPHWKSHG